MFNYDDVLDNNYNLDEIVQRIIKCEDKGEFMFVMREFNSDVLEKDEFEFNPNKDNNNGNNNSYLKQPSLQSILKNKNSDINLLDTGLHKKRTLITQSKVIQDLKIPIIDKNNNENKRTNKRSQLSMIQSINNNLNFDDINFNISKFKDTNPNSKNLYHKELIVSRDEIGESSRKNRENQVKSLKNLELYNVEKSNLSINSHNLKRFGQDDVSDDDLIAQIDYNYLK